MKLSIDLFDVSSIDEAIKKVESYKTELRERTELFVVLLAEELQMDAQNGFSRTLIDDGSTSYEGMVMMDNRPANVTVTLNQESKNVIAVVAEGEDAVWVEFGTGVFFNGGAGGSPHPKGAELGFVIGGYGKGKGKNRMWSYENEDGQFQLTRGTRAQLPFYQATQNTIDKIVKIAKEVFNSD